MPDENGEFAAKVILQFLKNTDEKDTIILLLSGGESALLPLPRNGIALQNKTETTRQLLLCGARIQETNAVRKHLSMIKGGNLAYKTRGTLITLILSDVLGDSLDSIASGPTVPDPTIYEDVSQILTKYNLWGKLPQNIERLIKRVLEDLEEETPKNIPKRHFVEIIASNKTCVNAGINKAKAMSFNTMLLTTYLEGEAKEVTHALSSLVKEIKNSNNPVDTPEQLLLVKRQLLRLQEMALAGEIKSSLCHLLLMCRVCQVFLWQHMQQTKGDGPTDTAGAFATGATFARACSLGIDPMLFLLYNDFYHFFDELEGLIKVPPTNTNVSDVIVILIE